MEIRRLVPRVPVTIASEINYEDIKRLVEITQERLEIVGNYEKGVMTYTITIDKNPDKIYREVHDGDWVVQDELGNLEIMTEQELSKKFEPAQPRRPLF